MSYLGYIFAPTFAAALLVAYPALLLMLLRRAGVRGAKLALAALPVLFIVAGAYVFQWLMTLQSMNGSLMMIALAKSVGVFIGAISPLLILALVRWPALDNACPQVRTLE